MAINMTSALLNYANAHNLTIDRMARSNILNRARTDALFKVASEKAKLRGMEMSPQDIAGAILAYPSCYSAGWKGVGVMSDRILNNWERIHGDGADYSVYFDDAPKDECPEEDPTDEAPLPPGQPSGDSEEESGPEGDEEESSEEPDGESEEESEEESEDDQEDEDPEESDSEEEGEDESSEEEEEEPEDDQEDDGESDDSEEEESEDEEEPQEEEEQPPEEDPQEEPEDEPEDDDFYIKPATYEAVKALILMGKKVLLVGPRGTGKTEMALRIGRELRKTLYMLTSPQMRSDVTGYADATGREVKSAVTTAITENGLLLIEEMDRSTPEALIPLNAMLANGMMDVPVRGTIRVNPAMRVIATANTNGHGATEEYGTANRLDGSTLDRFCVIRVDYDRDITMACVQSSGLGKADCESITNLMMEFRESCISQGLDEYVPSYRGAKEFADIIAAKGDSTGYFAGLSWEERCKCAINYALVKDAIPKDTLSTILTMVRTRNRYSKALEEYRDQMKEAY